MAGNNHAKPSPSSSHRKPSAADPKHRHHNTSGKPPPSKPNNNRASNPSPKPNKGPSSQPNPTQSNLPPFPFPDPPPPPSYGFHMLDRRTIVLSDGSVRSYLALPLDYQEFRDFAGRGGQFDRQFIMSPGFRGDLRGSEEVFVRNRDQEYRNLVGFDGPRGGVGGGIGPSGGGGGVGGIGIGPGGEMYNKRNSLVALDGPRGGGGGPGGEMANKRNNLVGFDDPRGGGGGGAGGEMTNKRKYVEEERQRQLLQYGNGGSGVGPSSGGYRGDEMRDVKLMRLGQGTGGRSKHSEVDQGALKKAFLHFVKVVFENVNQKKKYLDDGKQGPLRCLACQRSKDVPDMHALVMHAYNPESPDSLVDHLGFHKALCILMGWNFLMPPDISKLYQKLPADQATANQDDLILWPPLVIIHNTITGRGREGRMEGLGNRTMDNKLRDLGFSSGKSKALYSREGHLGITLVKFSGDQSGLKEAMQLANHFEKDGHGRRGWAQVPSSLADKDDGSNPHLVKVDPKTGEKNRILYGYLGTIMDIDKIDFETRKKVMVESRRDHR